MNEEVFNMQIRKFLKKVGVQSQREIEQAVKQSIEKGSLLVQRSWKLLSFLKCLQLDLRYPLRVKSS